MKLDSLRYWRDERLLSAATNMALDEALFEVAKAEGISIARFYQWGGPATTVGYFHQFSDNEAISMPRPIRRYTGGGVVEHGEDLTFLLALPARTGLGTVSTADRYEWIHEQLLAALDESGEVATMERNPVSSAGGRCFAQPVAADLIGPDGNKIAGGAQRRTRGGVIHQGSVRLSSEWRSPASNWIDGLLDHLAVRSEPLPQNLRNKAGTRAVALRRERYASAAWNLWP